MTLIDEPVLTHVVAPYDFELPENSDYLFAADAPVHVGVDVASWREQAVNRGCRIISLLDVEASLIVTSSSAELLDSTFERRDPAGFYELVSRFQSRIYIDITGMRYETFAQFLRVLLDTRQLDQVVVVYHEPQSYKRSQSPSRGLIFELSERLSDLAALPGFARLRLPRSVPCVVPILGFEGARFGHLLESLEPSLADVTPVLGLPGFKPEFPASSLIGNRVNLESQVFQSLRYARANCPFELFHVLVSISRDFPRRLLRVIPIGTRPHGLGSILYALSRPRYTELLYDFPVEREDRSSGIARTCLYDVGSFAQSELFLAAGDFAE